MDSWRASLFSLIWFLTFSWNSTSFFSVFSSFVLALSSSLLIFLLMFSTRSLLVFISDFTSLMSLLRFFNILAIDTSSSSDESSFSSFSFVSFLAFSFLSFAVCLEHLPFFPLSLICILYLLCRYLLSISFLLSSTLTFFFGDIFALGDGDLRLFLSKLSSVLFRDTERLTILPGTLTGPSPSLVADLPGRFKAVGILDASSCFSMVTDSSASTGDIERFVHWETSRKIFERFH